MTQEIESQAGGYKLQTLRAKLRGRELENSILEVEYLRTATRLRPSYTFPVKVVHDGLRWCCKLASESEAIGYGDCPHEAMLNFDIMWNGTTDDSLDR